MKKKGKKKMTKAPTNVTSIKNRYSIEYETQNGVDFPTFIFWARKPSDKDWERFSKENVDIASDRKPKDSASCVFGAIKLKLEQPAAKPKPMGPDPHLSVNFGPCNMPPSEPSMFRERVNLSLPRASHAALVKAAEDAGIQPGTLARLFVERALGLRKEVGP